MDTKTSQIISKLRAIWPGKNLSNPPNVTTRSQLTSPTIPSGTVPSTSANSFHNTLTLSSVTSTQVTSVPSFILNTQTTPLNTIINKKVTFRNYWGSYRYAKGTLVYKRKELTGKLLNNCTLVFTDEHEAKIRKAIQLLEEVGDEMFDKWPDVKLKIKKQGKV